MRAIPNNVILLDVRSAVAAIAIFLRHAAKRGAVRLHRAWSCRRAPGVRLSGIAAFGLRLRATIEDPCLDLFVFAQFDRSGRSKDWALQQDHPRTKVRASLV
jgi:hypothetical protein